MSFDSILNFGSIIVSIVMTLYIIAAVIYIIMENRSPQSTFAWLLLFIALPVVGIIIYIFFGHGWRAFSQETKLARQEMGGDIQRDVGEMVDRQQEYIDRIKKEKPAGFVCNNYPFCQAVDH